MQFENYPSRCYGLHTPINQVNQAGSILLRGRVIRGNTRRGVLADESGQLEYFCSVETADLVNLCVGDIVEMQGGLQGKGLPFEVERMRLLSRSIREYTDGDWSRFNADRRKLIETLRLRSRILLSIRHFFFRRDFIEVETPYLLAAPGQDAHIEHFQTTYSSLKKHDALYLITSPEHHMKRMLGGGLERIFQVARCFRNGEQSSLHNPEFTMVEWYRSYASYREIIEDTEDLIAHIARDLYGEEGMPPHLENIIGRRPWPQVSVFDAFKRWGDIDLNECRDAHSLYQRARSVGFLSATEEDSWDDIFHKVLLEKIEPELIQLGAVVLIDYPASLGALAKLKEGDRSVAERAEVYIHGVELANGYTELNAPLEQRQRFVEARGESTDPLDEEFLTAMECAIPPAGGMALGVDRLTMLMTNSDHLGEVLAFPYGAT